MLIKTYSQITYNTITCKNIFLIYYNDIITLFTIYHKHNMFFGWSGFSL
jgi:hypothetical protein